MEFVIKKTTELDEVEKVSLLDCFIEVFDHKRSMEEMLNQYLNTPMGYCVHSLCIDNHRIVAAHTAFPSYYWVGAQKIKTYITGDTMVRKEYRDGAVYLDVMMGLNQYMKKAGYAFVFGFPNENSYAVNKKGRLAVEFGRMDTYILPYRIGGIKRGLAWLNPLSKWFSKFWLFCCSVRAKDDVQVAPIHKDDESYNFTRYKRLDGDYNHIQKDNLNFYYKLKLHEGVRTAFIIDVIGKSETRFQNAIKYILKTEKDSFDLLMYVGHLPGNLRRIGLIKIPRKIEPKHFYMTGKVYEKSLDSKLICDINNWDVNLSDYDLI